MSHLKGIKVLLVDDEPHIVQFLKLGLINEGYEVRSAHDGHWSSPISRSPVRLEKVQPLR